MLRGLTDHGRRMKEERTASHDSETVIPLAPPDSLKHADWTERIRKARLARVFGRKIREGKPRTFQRLRWLK